MLEVALADRLRTSFAPFRLMADDEETWRLRALTWKDPRAVVGGSDAGAHLDMIDTFAFSTQLLQKGMRERGLITLEEAVHALTDVPARLYGLRERGRLEEGWRADIVVFDRDRIAVGPLHTRYDLPSGAGRLYAAAEGIEHVFVNGVEVARGEEFTGNFPGTVLRSGRDTETVTASPERML
ncbi:MAG: amidohydrolase family protein, partial [Candidatus Binatia bacterium]